MRLKFQNIQLFTVCFFLIGLLNYGQRRDGAGYGRENTKVTQNSEAKISPQIKQDIEKYTKSLKAYYTTFSQNHNSNPSGIMLPGIDDYRKLLKLVDEVEESGRFSVTLDMNADFIKNNLQYFFTTEVKSFLQNYMNTIQGKHLNSSSLQQASTAEIEAKLIDYGQFISVAESTKNLTDLATGIESLLKTARTEYNRLKKVLQPEIEKNAKSSFHKNNLNTIFISKEDEVYDHESNIDFLEEVVIDNNLALYFTLYNTFNVGSYFKEKGKKVLAMNIFFDEKIGSPNLWTGCHKMFNEAYDLSPEQLSQGYLTLPLMVNAEAYQTRDIKTKTLLGAMVGCLTKLSANEWHNTQLVVMFTEFDKKVVKNFKIMVTDKGIENLVNLQNQVSKVELANVRLIPRGSLHSDSYETQVRTYMLKKGFSNIKRININSNKWTVLKNTNYPYEILFKGLTGQLAYKHTNGKCYKVGFTIKKDYNGGGTYGDAYTKTSFAPGYGTEIPEGNIN